jgi:hypothetical protein
MQYVADNLSLMSVGFLLPSPDEAVIWRGPKKNGAFIFVQPYLDTLLNFVIAKD